MCFLTVIGLCFEQIEILSDLINPVDTFVHLSALVSANEHISFDLSAFIMQCSLMWTHQGWQMKKISWLMLQPCLMGFDGWEELKIIKFYQEGKKPWWSFQDISEWDFIDLCRAYQQIFIVLKMIDAGIDCIGEWSLYSCIGLVMFHYSYYFSSKLYSTTVHNSTEVTRPILLTY